MKRILVNANPGFTNQFKEHNGVSFFVKVLEMLKQMLQGLEIKTVEEDFNHAIYEFNDESNPIPCDNLQQGLTQAFDLNPELATISVYNYKPQVKFGFNFMTKSGNEYTRRVASINQLKQKLEEVIVGQDHAIDIVINALIKAYSFKNDEINKPLLTCLFAGPSGSGKTFLAENIVNGLKLPCYEFNGADYFANASEDKLIGFIANNPHGALILNDIEEFSPAFTSHLINMLLTGSTAGLNCRGLIIFLTTSGGRSIYMENTPFSYATLSAKEIIDSLRKELHPKIKDTIAFHPFLLDLLSEENVVMFNHLDVFSKQLLLAAHLKGYAKTFLDNTGIETNLNYVEFARFVMFSHSDIEDVKSLKKEAEKLFDEQIAFLAEQVDIETKKSLVELVKNINFNIELEDAEDKVKELFADRTIEVLFIARKGDYELFEKLNIENVRFNFAKDVEEVKALIDKDMDVILLDPTIGNRNRSGILPLDVEDYNSVGMDIFNYVVRYRNSTPLYLLNNADSNLPYSSFHTLILKGAEDVVTYSNEDTKGLADLISTLAINYELGYDIEFLHDEQLRLESNPAQELNKDEQGIYSLNVNYRKLQLRSAGISAFDVDELEHKDIKKFNDIIGNNIPKEILLGYGKYLSQTQTYLSSGLLPPKMILIHGDSEIGKTAIIKAFANECHAKLIKLDCKQLYMQFTSLEDLYSKIRNAFSNARRSSPCVLHLDNIEMLFPAMFSEVIEKCLTILKEEVEYTAKDIYHPVLIIGERYKRADIHPGIYEFVSRNIVLEVPTVEDVEEFITKFFEKKHVKTVSKKVIHNFARRNFPTVYSELKRILEFALNYAQDKPLTDELLSESLDVYNQGDLSAFQPTDEYRLSTAYHEMGHYLLMRLFGTKPVFVTIVPRGNYGGYTLDETDRIKYSTTKQEFLNEICVFFGGRAAEVIFDGEEKGINTGIGSDIRGATNIARMMVMYYAMGNKSKARYFDFELESNNETIYAQVNEILDQEYERAIKLLTLNRKNLDKLAQALYEKNSIIGDELEELVPDSDLLHE